MEKKHGEILVKLREKKQIDAALDGEIGAALKAFSAEYKESLS